MQEQGWVKGGKKERYEKRFGRIGFWVGGLLCLKKGGIWCFYF